MGEPVGETGPSFLEVAVGKSAPWWGGRPACANQAQGSTPPPHWGSEGSGWRGGAPWSLLLLPGWRCLVVSRVPPWLALVLRNWELQEELAAGPCWRGSPRWRSAAPAQGRATSQEGNLGGWQVVFRHESQAEAQRPCRLCRDVGGWGEDSASRTPLTASLGAWQPASEGASPCPGHVGPVPAPLTPLWGWRCLPQESDCPGRDRPTRLLDVAEQSGDQDTGCLRERNSRAA